MTTLAALHTKVSRAINKGTKYDTDIPGYVAQAAKYLEMTNSFKYMERFVFATLYPDDTTPNTVPLPATPKHIDFCRIVTNGSDGTKEYQEVTIIDPRDVKALKEGPPDHYWLDGVEFIVFDTIPDEEYRVEVSYTRYTPWPTDTSTADLWLVNVAEGLLLAQTILEMGPFLREPKLIAWYKDRRQEWLDAALRADEEMRHSNHSYYMHPDR